MGATILEKILRDHSDGKVQPGDIVEVRVDTRVARDFGGANVVKNLQDYCLGIDDPTRTFFTFDCNPGGSDQKYAANQHICRMFARTHRIRIFDIDQGIGTHIAIDEGLIQPGGVFVSTDSHANIMGAIGAFGQGMGDMDIAAAFSRGRVWFKVPPTVRITVTGSPSPQVTPKDVTLALLRTLGANGLLGYAAEVTGTYIETLGLSGRITLASMATEMGGISLLFPPTPAILGELPGNPPSLRSVSPDGDAHYEQEITVDITDLEPLVSLPGHPEDVTEVTEVQGIQIDSAFLGSCTNGRYEDLKTAAEILRGRTVAPGVVLKIVPATRKIWDHCLREGLIQIFMDAGALVGNPGCAGCAAGQIGQNGPGEITLSTGNRNFRGKQGKGEVYLASPATVAASAIAGSITWSERIPRTPARFTPRASPALTASPSQEVPCRTTGRQAPTVFRGRAWVIPQDNIDTDMIYHNRYLPITERSQMGQYTFDTLRGWEDFATQAHLGDILITGKNFGCGSSRQHAVDCFKSLGIALILAESFGAIYERNAINAAFPIMTYQPVPDALETGDVIEANVTTGIIRNITKGTTLQGTPFSTVQQKIYTRGGLLEQECAKA